MIDGVVICMKTNVFKNGDLEIYTVQSFKVIDLDVLPYFAKLL